MHWNYLVAFPNLIQKATLLPVLVSSSMVSCAGFLLRGYRRAFLEHSPIFLDSLYQSWRQIEQRNESFHQQVKKVEIVLHPLLQTWRDSSAFSVSGDCLQSATLHVTIEPCRYRYYLYLNREGGLGQTTETSLSWPVQHLRRRLKRLPLTI